MERVILHSDMNNFYASVECMLNPELKAYPIAVCGDVEERHGIVLAKNYKAKAKGVSTGEAIWQAKQKCPGLIIVPPHYDEYMKYSKKARAIYGRYTDEIEPFGINLFYDAEKNSRIEALDKAVEEIRARYGYNAIKNATLLQNPKMPSHNSPKLIMPTGVPQ